MNADKYEACCSLFVLFIESIRVLANKLIIFPKDKI